MVDWYTEIVDNRIKDEHYYKNTDVLEIVEVWASNKERIKAGKGYMNKVVTYNLRDYNGAIAFLRAIGEDFYTTQQTAIESGKEKTREVFHDGINFPETVDGHKAQLRLTYRAAQTILVAQGLGWVVGIRPDQEKKYLRETPIDYNMLLKKAESGDLKAEEQLIGKMARDRKTIFSAIERAERIYFMGTEQFESPPAFKKLLRKLGIKQRLSYIQLNSRIRRLSEKMVNQEKIVIKAKLAYLSRKKKPILLARKL